MNGCNPRVQDFLSMEEYSAAMAIIRLQYGTPRLVEGWAPESALLTSRTLRSSLDSRLLYDVIYVSNLRYVVFE